MAEFIQVFVDMLTWFLMPFASILAISWVVSMFRK